MNNISSWKAQKIWNGSDCHIIGGGPSWLSQFEIPQTVIDSVRNKQQKMTAYAPYLSFLHNKHVIGVNGAFQLGPWISVCVFKDETWFEQYKKPLLTEFSGLRITDNEIIMEKSYVKNHIKYLKQAQGKMYGISEVDGSHAYNGNSGAFAINVAYHFGIKRIFLYGFDMNLTGGFSHFHGDYGASWSVEVAPNHLTCFPEIARDAKRLGIQIYNVNPDSSIKDFPKITLQDILKGW